MNQKFENIIIMHQTIEVKTFRDHSFQRSNIQNVHIHDCMFDTCDFSRSSLTNLRISDCCFVGCKFLNVDLSFCNLSNCTFNDCDFSLAEIENINFFKSILSNTKFISARLTNNAFLETSFFRIDLNGSTTKFNCFEESIWTNSVFGNCTIDYNIAIGCKFKTTKMNIETMGSVWGLQEEDLEDITFLSLGREIAGSKENIQLNYKKYILKKRLCLEIFTLQVSMKRENVFDNLEQLLNGLNERYTDDQYLSPDELRYFYEILKAMRKESLLPLLVLKEILLFSKELVSKIPVEDSYYETFLLFYNNICLIYNSMIHELSSYHYDIFDNNCKYLVKITFKEKPQRDIVQIFRELYQYVYNAPPISNLEFVKDEHGSYIIWIIMPLAALAAFNIGTLLLTGGVKHLIKLRASIEVLFSKKLPRKYYLDVYKKDDSEEVAKGIISMLLSREISSLSPGLRNLSSDGINAHNIKDISAEGDQSASA